MNIIIRIITKIKRIKFENKFASKLPRSSGLGNKGYGDRCHIEGHKYILIGKHSWLGEGTELLAYGKNTPILFIGDNVHFQCRDRITCAYSISIGDNVLLGPEVFITDHNHGMNPEIETGYLNQPLLVKKVIIEEGVWLGQRAVILPGVTIGKHSIIGAGSIVTHDIPEYVIAVGNPAKVIKKWDFDKHIWIRVN